MALPQTRTPAACLASTAALNLKPVVLELGGKNSAIVLDDANLETAAVQIILGAFMNSGQTCMATDRVLVDSKIAGPFEAIFSAIIEIMFNSKNTPSAIVNTAVMERINTLISQAKSKGASALSGGWESADASEPSVSGQYKDGIFMRPIILKDVTKHMRIWSNEVFGSVVTLHVYNTEEEAIKIANDTPYGLSQAVFTEDLCRGLRVAKALESVQVHINAMTLHEAPEMPFGGVKESGWGRFNATGIDEFLVTKAVTWMD